MRSYVISVTLSMVIAGIYVLENTGMMTVRFLGFESTFSQAVWPIICFSVGVAIMWLASLIAGLEIRLKYRNILKERDARILAVEEERNSLLQAFNNAGLNEKNSHQPYSSAHDALLPTDGAASQQGVSV